MRILAMSIIAAVAACDTSTFLHAPDADLNRMIDQPRADAFEASPFFADASVLQNPPEGIVARDAVVDAPALEHGYAGLTYAEHVMVPIDERLLARGHDRFEVFCAPCHGLTGEGNGPVSRKLPSVPARSLHDPRIRAYSAGQIYRTINEGFGMMGSYAAQLSRDDRWAVVAYVQALQRSRHYDVASLKQDERARLEAAP
jgi:mono/diheme cytochrome c family protein